MYFFISLHTAAATSQRKKLKSACAYAKPKATKQASKQGIELGSFLQRLADYRNGWLGLVAEMNQAHD